jgi:hypothetical protein
MKNQFANQPNLHSKIKRALYNSKKEKIRNEANLGPNNLWKAVKIAQEKTQASYPDEMQDFDGQKMCAFRKLRKQCYTIISWHF